MFVSLRTQLSNKLLPLVPTEYTLDLFTGALFLLFALSLQNIVFILGRNIHNHLIQSHYVCNFDDGTKLIKDKPVL